MDRDGANVDHDTSLRRLTELIDFELAQGDVVDARAGWNKWALVAAIGTLGWLILGELREESFRWPMVVWVVLCASIVEDIFVDLNTLLDGSSKPSLSQPRFFVSNRDLSGFRLAISAQLARFCLLLGAALLVPSLGPTWSSTIFVTYLALMGAFGFMALLITFISLPIARALPSKVGVLGSFVRLVLLVAIAIGFISGLSGIPEFVHSAELRLGALVWAAGFVALLLLNASQSSPLTASLRNIRRDLSLGILDVETARREVDIALRGLRVADLLQDDVQRLLEIWRKAIARLEASSAKLNIVIAALPPPHEPLSDAEKHLAQATLEELASSDKETTASFAALRASLTRFKVTASRLIASTYFLGVNVKGDLSALAESVDQLQKVHDTKATELLGCREALLRRVEACIQ